MVADRGGVVLWCYGAVVAGAAAGARAQGRPRAEATADQGQIRSVAKSDDTMDQIDQITLCIAWRSRTLA
jgi:hypothetical protein